MDQSGHATPLRPLTEIPQPRIGILGGGQLAKMLAAAAAQYACEVVIVERQEDFPAQSLDTHAIIGDFDDPTVLRKLVPLVDVVTLESEFVSTDALATLPTDRCPLFPSASTMERVQDKLRQKQSLLDAGLPVTRFADAPTREAVRAFGFPAVLKKRCQSYDGKGNATVQTEAELEGAWTKLDGDRYPLYVEAFCPFRRELAVIVTRGRDGQVVRYPVVETVNRNHICHLTKGPIDAPHLGDMAERAITAFDGVGSFGMELFEMPDGSLFVNEIAPRVHNTGHYTIEACECSQFENHLRAVLGWPLGSPALVAPAAAMVNLLGSGGGSGTPHGLVDALRLPGVHVHVYGKTRSSSGRKMGHVTALGQTPDEAAAKAQVAADLIRFGE